MNDDPLSGAALRLAPQPFDDLVLRAAASSSRFSFASDEAMTVVVPTVGRWSSLAQCLDRIRPQLREDDELLVVINSPSTPPAGLLRSGVTMVNEPRRGAGWARNAGWTMARHSAVAFADDDTLPDRLWLDTLRASLAAHDVVTGSVIGANADLPASALFDAEYPLHRGWLPRDFDGETFVAARDTWRVGVGASMAWRREVLSQIRGFDPALGNGCPGGGAEDIDAFHRALRAGARLRYEPRALVWHWHPESISALSGTIRSYQRAFGAWATKLLIEDGLRAAPDVMTPIADSYRSFLRSLTGRSALPPTALLAAAPDAAAGAIAFLRSASRSRRGDSVSLFSVRHNQQRPFFGSDVEVELSDLQIPPDCPRPTAYRALIRSAGHPVALIEVAPPTPLLDALTGWARWFMENSGCAEGQ